MNHSNKHLFIYRHISTSFINSGRTSSTDHSSRIFEFNSFWESQTCYGEPSDWLVSDSRPVQSQDNSPDVVILPLPFLLPFLESKVNTNDNMNRINDVTWINIWWNWGWCDHRYEDPWPMIMWKSLFGIWHFFHKLNPDLSSVLWGLAEKRVMWKNQMLPSSEWVISHS